MTPQVIVSVTQSVATAEVKWVTEAASSVPTIELPAHRTILKGAQPFPERWNLNQRVFEDADASAARELHDHHGVRFLLVDHTHGTASPDIARLGRLAYSNAAISVYSLS